MKTWYAYCITPIDFGSEFLRTVQETEDELTRIEKLIADGAVDSIVYSPKQFAIDWQTAQILAGKLSWEHDYREPPRVFWLPTENEFCYGFFIKQDNNGTTFIISPQPLTFDPGILLEFMEF